MTKLRNLQHEKFAQEYAAHGSARDAALAAGYSDAKKGANVRGCELLKNPTVMARICQLQKQHADRSEVTADRVIRRLAIEAFSTIEGIVRVAGGEVIITDTDNLSSEQLATILSVRRGRDGAVAVTMRNNFPALQELCKITGLSNDLNFAIATFAKYGIDIKQRDGKFFIPES